MTIFEIFEIFSTTSTSVLYNQGGTVGGIGIKCAVEIVKWHQLSEYFKAQFSH